MILRSSPKKLMSKDNNYFLHRFAKILTFPNIFVLEPIFLRKLFTIHQVLDKFNQVPQKFRSGMFLS